MCYQESWSTKSAAQGQGRLRKSGKPLNATDDILSIFLTNYPKALQPNECLDISTPSKIPIGPFARQAQVSHLLNRLLTHIREPTFDENLNFEE